MIEAFWASFVEATGIDGPHTAWAFGSALGPDIATELALLVRDGPKRATTSLLVDYRAEDEELPHVGELSVIVDGEGVPVCVIRTTEVTVSRFGDVDEGFAWDEGEGDRSLDDWRRIHRWAFAQEGREIDDDTVVVLERFELLWPMPMQQRQESGAPW